MDAEERERIEALKKMWPRPRVGERLRLRVNGKVGEVLSVRMAKEVLKNLSEAHAIMFIPSVSASFGKHWTEIYYEADIYISGRLVTVNTRDVEEVLPPI